MQHVLPSPDDKIQPGQQELTPTQRAGAQQFAQEWREALLSVGPVDEAEAEVHLCQAYRVAGLEPPRRIRWFDSPLAFGRECLAPESEQSIWNNLQGGPQASVWNTQWNGARERVWSSVRSSVLTEVEEYLWASIRDQGVLALNVQRGVDVSLRRHLETCLWEKLWNHVQEHGWEGDDTRARLLTRVNHVIWQSLWAYQLAGEWACYGFLQDWLADNDLAPLARVHRLVSGSWLGSQEAWLVRKPVRLERDEQDRLHSATGPAVQYCDGWGISAWHGVRVPHDFILAPETLTREQWLAEPNVEARRVMQELLGTERFIALMEGTCIDHGIYGDLFEVPLGDDPEGVAHYVRVKDASTERIYYLRVPRWIRLADEAVAWTFNLSANAYQPIQET